MPETLFPMPEESSKPAIRGKGQPRLKTANRHQVEMRLASLDEILPEDHVARAVWEMAREYDLGGLYDVIDAVEGEVGRPAIDPRLLLTVWLYATIEGVGSARAVARLCQYHLAYKWLLGGMSVNYHTLADFRVNHEAVLDAILTRSVAALMSEGLVDLEQTAQDGVRARASAGASSFRRAETLRGCLRQAEERVQQLKAETQTDGGQPLSKRPQAARKRHARDRVERVKHAVEEVDKIAAKKAQSRELKRKNSPTRASSTDPEARVTKMPDGGFRPAYNGQPTVDMKSRIIAGVDVSNEADQCLLEPMVDQVEERYGRLMDEHYVDGGIRSNAGITALGKRGVRVYCPIRQSGKKNSQKKPEEVPPSDSPQVAEWKRHMVTPEAQQKYRWRAATVEWANALLRKRGLQRFLVRGLPKVRAVLLWFVLAHNLVQTFNLRRQTRAAPT